MNNNWGWLKSGLILGLVFLMAVVFVKPIGVSTQYVVADAALIKVADKNLIQKKSVDGKDI